MAETDLSRWATFSKVAPKFSKLLNSSENLFYKMKTLWAFLLFKVFTVSNGIKLKSIKLKNNKETYKQSLTRCIMIRENNSGVSKRRRKMSIISERSHENNIWKKKAKTKIKKNEEVTAKWWWKSEGCSLLFRLRIQRREKFENGHKKSISSIRKWEVRWSCSQRLHTWLLFIFIAGCCKEVKHVARKTKGEKEATIIIRENQKGSCLPCMEI